MCLTAIQVLMSFLTGQILCFETLLQLKISDNFHEIEGDKMGHWIGLFLTLLFLFLKFCTNLVVTGFTFLKFLFSLKNIFLLKTILSVSESGWNVL